MRNKEYEGMYKEQRMNALKEISGVGRPAARQYCLEFTRQLPVEFGLEIPANKVCVCVLCVCCVCVCVCVCMCV